MSQGDYISKKKIISQILNQDELPPILDSSLYTTCMSYSKSITISTPSTFLTYYNTNNRPNRVMNNSPLYSNISKYVKHKKEKEIGCNKCKD